MSEFTRPVQNLSQDTWDYVDLKVDDLKLRTTKGLSIALNQVLSLMVVVMTASIFLLALAVGLIMLLGKLIGSYAGGAFIIAAIFAVAAFILYKKKDTLFLNTFIKIFVKIFFDDDDEGSPIKDVEGKKVDPGAASEPSAPLCDTPPSSK